MSNALYPSCKAQFLSGSIDWRNDTFKVALLSSAYAYDSTHAFYSDLAGIIGVPAAVESTVLTVGSSTVVADAANTTLDTVPSGHTVVHYVVYKDTGSADTSPLVAYFGTGTGLPFNTNGGSVTIVWPDAGIFEF